VPIHSGQWQYFTRAFSVRFVMIRRGPQSHVLYASVLPVAVLLLGLAVAGHSHFRLSAVAPTFDLSIHEGGTRRPDLCLRVALGSDTSYECGTLRVGHALPETRTMSRVRAPVLSYNSDHASPFVLVPVHVTLPSHGSVPTTVTVKLTSGGATLAEGTWTGSAWTPGATRRVTLGFATSAPSGVHSYNIEVVNWYGSTPYPSYSSGQYTVVNRIDSPFATGWWLAGLERLDVATMTVVDGGGGVRRYEAAGSGRWAAQQVTRPDTLLLRDTTYVRLLPGGAEMVFNLLGQHVRTVNALGHATSFEYVGGRLSVIRLPGGVPAHEYVFTYDAQNLLQSITAPGGRVTTVSRSGTLLSGIQDPDGHSVSFGYSGSRIASRTDRRGTVTNFAYDPATWRLTQAHLDPAVVSIVTSFTPAEGRGFGSGATPAGAVIPDSAFTLLDGPRTDVLDHTRFWIDPYGAPSRIRDALAAETVLQRANPAFPGLVTRVDYPGDYAERTEYNARGNVTHRMSINARGTAAEDTTRYVYYAAGDPRVDHVRVVVPPLRDSVVSEHNTNGTVAWRQDARGSSSRSSFTYDGNGLLRSAQAPDGAVDSLFYDARGNLSASRTALGHVRTHQRDALGRDTMVTTPIEDSAVSVTRQSYDAMGRPLVTRSEGPAISYTCVNCLGSAMVAAPAQTLIVTNGYDEEGNLISVLRQDIGAPSGVDSLRSTFQYDRAGRKIVDAQFGRQPQNFQYDKAGNLTHWSDGLRPIPVHMHYDALNRLTLRAVPSIFYARDPCQHQPLGKPPCLPNLAFDSLHTPRDTQTFAYDASSRLVAAHNRNARVTRSYFPGGELRTDTIRMRIYGQALLHDGSPPPGGGGCDPHDPKCNIQPMSGGGIEPMSGGGVGGASALPGDPYPNSEFTTHIWGIAHTWDANGRRTQLHYPASLGGSRTLAEYSYHPWGALQYIDGLDSERYSFAYDNSGRLTSLTYPGSRIESYGYDLDGRRTYRALTGYYDDVFSFDAQGRLRTAALNNLVEGPREAESYYSGLGHVLASRSNATTSGDFQIDEHRFDGHGNMTWSRSRNVHSGPNAPVMQHTYDGAGRAREIAFTRTPQTNSGSDFYRAYDWAGNMHYATEHPVDGSGVTYTLVPERHYYNGENKLIAIKRYSRTTNNQTGELISAADLIQEFRYDALGRRIIQHTRHKPSCSAQCEGTLDRYLWDGDQLLVEMRATGDGNWLENAIGAGRQQGRVTYLHGPGIDAPLAVHRYGFIGTGHFRVSPFANWRGQYEYGDFTTMPECNGSNAPNCAHIDWPGPRVTTFLQKTGPAAPADWAGSLLLDQRDASGLLFRRNRYYDPATGQFTQEDPIGLAGGLNLYGFGGGDPINFTDPFGLCPQYLTGRPCHNPIEGRMTLRTSWNPNVGRFGMTRNQGTRAHQGLDILAPIGKRVGAADGGTVVFAGDTDGDHGLMVIIAHANADGNVVSYTSYSHLSSISIEAGATVRAGSELGQTGNSGNAAGTPPHLHFEIRSTRFPGRGLDGRIDPEPHLNWQPLIGGLGRPTQW
jgi:RHS repeat-associated protein